MDDLILPFSEVLDWTLASVKCPSCDLRSVVSKLRSLPAAMVSDWRMQVLYFYRRYFSSMAVIVMTTLGILNDRVFTISARSYDVRVELPLVSLLLLSPTHFPHFSLFSSTLSIPSLLLPFPSSLPFPSLLLPPFSSPFPSPPLVQLALMFL